MALGWSWWRGGRLSGLSARQWLVLLVLLGLTILPNIATQTKWNIHYRSTAALQMELAALLLFACDLLPWPTVGRAAARWARLGLLGGVVLYSLLGPWQAIRNAQAQYRFVAEALTAAAASGEADLCPQGEFLRYDQYRAETLVDDTLLPIDFSYPVFYSHEALQNLVKVAAASAGLDLHFRCGPGSFPLALDMRRARVNHGGEPPRPPCNRADAGDDKTSGQAPSARQDWPPVVDDRGQFLQSAGKRGQ